jgi:hypothetical protein
MSEMKTIAGDPLHGPTGGRAKPLVHAVLIVAIGLVVYSNTLDVPFHFDDIHKIPENVVIKDLSYFFKPSNIFGSEYYEIRQRC